MEDETLARAVALARSGRCPDVEAIRLRLHEEGHDRADEVVAAGEVRLELGRLCRQANMKVRRRPPV